MDNKKIPEYTWNESDAMMKLVKRGRIVCIIISVIIILSALYIWIYILDDTVGEMLCGLAIVIACTTLCVFLLKRKNWARITLGGQLPVFIPSFFSLYFSSGEWQSPEKIYLGFPCSLS